ncbi:MAG: hydroxymethylpyrimidine/phosphomethylpyrimidine kinase [Chromatiales bacterium]|jgi:hydroxymethylpyrimidine/phosphomethylpyrimidine kinase
MSTTCPPLVLAVAGHDPSGGAGIQADIEAIGANGAAAATAVTCLTVQDTRDVRRLVPVDPELTLAQVEAVLSDRAVSVVKIGLLGSADLARGLADLLDRRAPGVTVVLDPVLRAGGGSELADAALRQALTDVLMPRVALATPNLPEACRLTGAAGPESCARALQARGAAWVLVTGTHDGGGPTVTNRLYGPDGEALASEWARLPQEYHGSGCTLASATAALLARGLGMENAVERAQAYTWHALAAGCRPGRGQWLPDRLHRTRGSAA